MQTSTSSGLRAIASAAPSYSAAGEPIPQPVADYFRGRGETWMLDLASLATKIREGHVKESAILRALVRAYLDDVPLGEIGIWARIMTHFGFPHVFYLVFINIVKIFEDMNRGHFGP